MKRGRIWFPLRFGNQRRPCVRYFLSGSRPLSTLQSIVGLSAGGNVAGSWIGAHYAVQKGDRLIRICLILALVGIVMKLLWSQG